MQNNNAFVAAQIEQRIAAAELSYTRALADVQSVELALKACHEFDCSRVDMGLQARIERAAAAAEAQLRRSQAACDLAESTLNTARRTLAALRGQS